MAKSFSDVRVLLLQARDTPNMEAQERACFVERCRIEEAQLTTCSTIRDALTPDLLDGYDALLIGGAGEYSAYEDHPWTPALLELVRVAGERRLPTFGSCWGHQVIARTFGGSVIYDTERAELGACDMQLTDAALSDPLFGAYPRHFLANTGHHDRVAHLPEGAVELAFNASQRNQAFRMHDRPMYGTQFHSELDADAERERLIAYRDYYSEEMGSDVLFQTTLASLADTTEVDHLLYDFLRVCVCGLPPSVLEDRQG